MSGRGVVASVAAAAAVAAGAGVAGAVPGSASALAVDGGVIQSWTLPGPAASPEPAEASSPAP